MQPVPGGMDYCGHLEIIPFHLMTSPVLQLNGTVTALIQQRIQPPMTVTATTQRISSWAAEENVRQANTAGQVIAYPALQTLLKLTKGLRPRAPIAQSPPPLNPTLRAARVKPVSSGIRRSVWPAVKAQLVKEVQISARNVPQTGL